MAKMKGLAWLGNMEFLEQLAGPAGMEKVKAALSKEDAEIVFGQKILPTSWVDYNVYMRFMLTADRVLGTGNLDIIKKATMYNASKDLRGIYKVFISIVSPKTLINNAPKLWKQYFDTGMMTAHWLDDKRVSLRVDNFPGMPMHHEIPQTGFITECLRISGAKEVSATHPRCIARGDDHCSFEFSWK